mmetsp:Transcript_629/g.1125  ORF Transcript_629/g.1125 Transcript_629/m.1125 type:complete len:85 (-) Transcript_629:2199-2453(-)
MQKKDLVKIPPILVKLRQQKLKSSLSLTSQFPSIDMFLDRLNSKAMEAKEKQMADPSCYEGEHVGDLLSKITALDVRKRRHRRQ